MSMWCPRCDQGKVWRVQIIKTGEVVHVCEECEALWPGQAEVSATGFIDFKTYVTPDGLKGAWSELKELPDSGETSSEDQHDRPGI